MHLLTTIRGFGNPVNVILPLSAQFPSTSPRTQIDAMEKEGTSRVARGLPQDRQLRFGVRASHCRTVLSQIAARRGQAGAFPLPDAANGPVRVVPLAKSQPCRRHVIVKDRAALDESRPPKHQIEESTSAPQPVSVIPARLATQTLDWSKGYRRRKRYGRETSRRLYRFIALRAWEAGHLSPLLPKVSGRAGTQLQSCAEGKGRDNRP